MRAKSDMKCTFHLYNDVTGYFIQFVSFINWRRHSIAVCHIAGNRWQQMRDVSDLRWLSWLVCVSHSIAVIWGCNSARAPLWYINGSKDHATNNATWPYKGWLGCAIGKISFVFCHKIPGSIPGPNTRGLNLVSLFFAKVKSAFHLSEVGK